MKKEIPYIHFIRVVACAMVVLLHTLPPSSLYHMDSEFGRMWNNLVVLFSKPCVPLFLMITGSLILPYKEDNSVDFYKKRIPRVLYPLLFWGIIYAVIPYCLGMIQFPEMLRDIVLSPIQAPTYIGGILWYLFILIGLYLFLPYFTTDIYSNKKLLQRYLILWIASSLSLLVLVKFPMAFGVNIYEHNFTLFIYFSGYMGYVLAGYYMRQYVDFAKMKWGGVKGTLLILYVVIILICMYRNVFYDSFLSIGTIIITLILFLFMMGYTNENRSYKVVKYISKNTFGIYLSHMLIFRCLTINLYDYFDTSYYIHLTVFFFTFISALIFAGVLSQFKLGKFLIG